MTVDQCVMLFSLFFPPIHLYQRQMQQDLERAEASLQDAMAQIRDLNTQITILSTG